VDALGDSPVSEKYLVKGENWESEYRVPLDLYFCNECTHVQLIHVVDPKYLWADFTFKTGNNPSLVTHFGEYVEKILSLMSLEANDLITDIGSNDGTMLRCFADRGFKNVLGIDPAEEIALDASNRGIRTLPEFMNLEMAHRLVDEYGESALVTANNVYAHVNDLSELTDSISYILRSDGLFVFEVSYLLDVIEKNLIGTIFHEHLSYHSITALKSFLSIKGLELVHVERGPEQGGSLTCYAQFENGPYRLRNSVTELIDLERDLRLGEAVTIREMHNRLELIKNRLRLVTSEIGRKGLDIAGFGAARAGTTLLSYFGIGDQLKYLVDDNELKHYKFSPGDHHEVLPTAEIYSRKPRYLLILAWIHADRIIESHNRYLDDGGAFIRIFPEVEIIASGKS
jgi:SAM-dependent methyltransferase